MTIRPLGIALLALLASPAGGSPERHAAHFSLCHGSSARNCVIDGDTFRLSGAKIRIADIDTPEIHEPRCRAEAALGDRATHRLRALLNAGAFSLKPVERSEDRYGRMLRIVMREGRSIGRVLVTEGLARPWTGSRQPWCRR